MRFISLILLLFIGCKLRLSAQTEAHNTQTITPLATDIIAQFPQSRDFTLSPAGNEAFFTGQSALSELSAIIFMRKEKDQWVKPEVAPFSGKYNDLEPFFSPDGLKLYFVSNRPLTAQTDSAKDFDIWYVQRTALNSPWSSPVNIGSPVNTKADEFYPAVSATNNLLFTSEGHQSKGKDDIFYCKWMGSGYDNPISVSDSINTDGYEFNAYLAPDESFILYTAYNRPGGLGSGDLYISRKKKDGTWSSSLNLGGAINSKSMDYCPYVDIPHAMLYFTSKRSRLSHYTMQRRTLPQLLKIVNDAENGTSRIYMTSFAEYLSGSEK